MKTPKALGGALFNRRISLKKKYMERGKHQMDGQGLSIKQAWQSVGAGDGGFLGLQYGRTDSVEEARNEKKG